MKLFVVLAVIAAVAGAAPAAGPESQAKTLQSDSDVRPDGYNFSYMTDNGIQAQEDGQLTNVGAENEAINVRGQYSYTGPDGVVYSVTYTAGENGFEAQGAHLPV